MADLLEREGELERLAERVRALVSEGAGGAVLVEGPPGIGKSSLLTAAAASADGAEVLRAHGAELESSLSFGAVRELFAPAVMRAGDREALFAGPAGLARPVLGFTPEASATGDPLYGLFWFAAALAERRPLLLVIDDLHWLDEESARFVVYLARRVEGLPILLLTGARPAEPGSDPGPAAAIAEIAEVIRPAPLGAEAVGRLVPGRSAADVLRVTGGNPLLAVEVGRALDAAGPDARIDRIAPASVGRAVLERVARMSEAAVALARAVALASEPLALADAAVLAGLDTGTAATTADALVRAQVLVGDEAGRLGFLHPVMRTAVYEEIDPFERRAAHRRAAKLLGERGEDVEIVAAHLLAAEPAGDEAAVGVLRAAADRALARAAPRAAVRYLRRALEEPPPPGESRVAMRSELGRLQASLGRVEAIATLRAVLDEATAPEQRAATVTELAEAYCEAERFAEAITLLEHAREDMELSPDQRLEVDALILTAALERLTEPEQLAAYAGRIPRDLPGRTFAERRALIVLAYYLLIEGGSAADAIKLLARTDNDDDIRRPTHVGYRVRCLSLCGELEAASALAEELIAHARATGREAVYAGAQLQLAVAANQRGELREAEAALGLGLASPGLTPHWRTTIEDWLVTTLSMQGRFDEAEQMLGRMVGPEDNIADAMLDRRHMELAMDRGDYAAALEPAERVYRLADRRIPANNALAFDYAIVLAHLGRAEEALPIARRGLEAALRMGTPQAIGIGHWALGHALAGDEAIAEFEQAIAVLRQTPFRWNLANAEVTLGAALRRTGRRMEARVHLLSALDYAARNGAAPIEERAREELRLTGARPRRAVRTGLEALTPSEDRIARLAADGMTNREIAQHLFLTVRTVEMHLGAAYRKLDVAGRRELPAIYAQAARPGEPERAAAPR